MSSNTIKIKAGSGTPTTSDIQDRELAFDRSADKLYINDAGSIVDLTGSASLDTEAVQDIVGAMFTSNTETRISATYQDGDGTIDLVVDDMTADTNTQLSTEQVQDIVGAMFTGNTETRITATYQDTDGTIDLVVDDLDTDTQLTTENVQDIVGAMFTSNTETRISATYQDGDGTIDLVVDDMTADNNTNQLTTFTLTADSGSNQTIAHGNTLDIAGGTNITTSVGSTDTVTINVDDAFIKNDANDTSSGTITAAGFTTSGTITVDDIHGNSNSTNRLVLDDDTNSSVANGVSLTGVNHIYIACDETNNGTGAVKFLKGTDNDLDSGTSVELAQFDNSGNLSFREDSNTQTRYVHLPRGGGITFYGDKSVHHSITSRDDGGNVTDDLCISSYGAVYIDIDSNDNNTSNASFEVGRHNAANSPFFVIDGETGNITVSGTVDGRDIATDGSKLDGIASGATANTGTVTSANGSNNRIATFSSSTAINGEANLTFDGTDLAIAATGKIYLDGGGNSYIQEESADNLIFRAAGGNYLRVTGSNIVLNDPGASYDVRIEGDSDSNLFFTDGSADKVGIGTNSPDTKLDITASGVHGLVMNQDGSNADISSRLFFKEQNSTIALYNTGDTFSFRTGATINSTSGTQRFYVNTSGASVVGDLGVSGNTVLQYGLVVNEGSNDADFRAEGNGEANLLKVDAGNDRVGVGEGSPISRLHVQDASDISMASTGVGQMSVEGNGYTLGIALNGSGAFIYHNSSSRFLSLGTNETEQVRLTTGGALHVVNDVVAFSSTPSDKKLKTNVKDIDYGLDTVMKLKPKQYDWKKDDRHDIGFIAQEVEEVIPEIVKDNEWFDDKVKTLDYEKLTAVLIKAVQELKTEIEELKK